MKALHSLLLTSLLLSACSPVNDQTIETETPEPEATESYPLYLTTMTHMEGGWMDDKDEDLFLRHVDQLHYGMDLAEEYDAILTIETEKPFARGNTTWGVAIMKEVLDRGHGVGTHCDIGGLGQKKLTLAQQILQMKENKALVDELVGAENNHGCSGAAGTNDWAQAAVEAGFDYINGIVSMHLLAIPEENRPDDGLWTDEYIDENYHESVPEDLADRIYLMQLANTLDFEPDDSGIVVSSGELGRVDALTEGSPDDCPKGNCPFTTEDVDVLIATIAEVNTYRDPSRVAKLTIYMPASNFVEENEEALRYLFSEMQKLQEAGQIQWASQWEVVETYLDTL